MKCRLLPPLLALGIAAAGGGGDVRADEPRVIVFGTGHRIIAKGEPITELDQDAYAQDLIAIVANAAGLKARIVEKDSLNELVAALARGEIDVVAMVARVPERSGSMLFSVPHVRGALVAVTRSGDAQPASVADLKGKSIALAADTLQYTYAKKRGWLGNALVLNSGNSGMELEAVADGTSDVAILNEFSAISMIERLGFKKRLRIAMTLPESMTEFCMAVRPTDGELLAQLNEGLFIAGQRGDLQRNYEKWFHQFEMSGLLQQYVKKWLLLGAGSVVLVALLSWGRVRYSLRNAQRRTEEVARLVEARTGELAAANRQLRHSEEKFSKAFRASPDAITITQNSDGVFIDINEGFTRLFGYDRSEVLGHTAVGLDLWNSSRDRDRVIEEFRNNGRVQDVSLLLRRKGGGIRTCSVSMESIKIGDTDCTVTVVRDITERERAAAALRESEARFRTLVESAPEAIIVFDSDSRQVTDANENALRMFEASREELLAVDIDRLSPQLQADGRASDKAVRELIRRTLAGETPAAEWLAQSLRGRPISVELRLVRLPAVGRNLVRGSLTDISDRKRLEEQLGQAQRMESIGQLAGGIAHDFNNILTVIQGNASLLLADEKFPQEYNEPVQQIAQSSTFAAGLTRQLLVFSRKQMIQRTSLDINAVIQHTSRLLRRVIGEDITFEVQLAGNLPQVFADNGMIEQVLLNLVVNSRDSMPRGGRLTIATSLVERDEAYRRRVPQALGGRYVCIAVADTGSGISADIMPRIFDPFFTTKEVGKGTGLGLATVYGIVQQHQGWIELDSSVGVGTEFRVHFPCIDASAGPAPEPDTGEPRETRAETILVVEDEALVRLTSCTILQRGGYNVLEAASPRAALELWAANRDKINLVFTDVVMPGGMTGRDLVEILRRDRPELKALFTSGYSSDLLGHDFVRTSASFFLQKPFGAAELKRIVSECLHPASSVRPVVGPGSPAPGAG
jgi:PAS domain S-box-containing protein